MAKALFLFVILSAGIWWTEDGYAYEPWDGKVTTDLNVRSSPQVGAQVIAWLKKGRHITVNDEEEKWYKIVFEIEGKRDHTGWVHSRYIEKIFPEKEDISSALAKIRAKIALEQSQKKPLLESSINETSPPNGMEKEVGKASSTSAANPAAEKQRPVTPSEGFVEGKKDRADISPEKAHAAGGQTGGMPPLGSSVPEMEATSRAPVTTAVIREPARVILPAESPAPGMVGGAFAPPPATAPLAGKRPDRPVGTIDSVGEKSVKQEPMTSPDRKGLNGSWEFKDLAKLAFRLLSVVLSCLAILFSYKAITLAKISYNTAMQFQNNLPVWQQREDGQTG